MEGCGRSLCKSLVNESQESADREQPLLWGFGEKDGGLGSGSRGASSLGAQFSPQEKSELALAPHSRFPFATIRCSYKRHYLPNPWLPWLAPGVQGCWDPYQFSSRLSPTLGVQYVPFSALLD